MKRTIRYLRKLWLAFALLGAAAAWASASDMPRQRRSLDIGWKFRLGDDWPDALRLDKAGVSSGAAAALEAQRRVVPVAQNRMTFAIAGPGKITGVGNRDPDYQEPNVIIGSTAQWSHSLFNRLAQIIVQSTRATSEIHLSADGLTPATTLVHEQPCAPRSFVP